MPANQTLEEAAPITLDKVSAEYPGAAAREFLAAPEFRVNREPSEYDPEKSRSRFSNPRPWILILAALAGMPPLLSGYYLRWALHRRARRRSRIVLRMMAQD